jgi:A/G-specific adenine glycosylase
VTDLCAWRRAGYPAYDGPARTGQTYDGTDRQCRGRLLAVLRETQGAVSAARLDAAWTEEAQRVRCLASLVADGLVVRSDAGYALP